MTSDAPCPRCSSKRVVEGQIIDLLGVAISFRPRKTSWNSLVVPIEWITACSECGFVWSEISTEHLRYVIAGCGTDEAKEWLVKHPDIPL